MEKEEKELEIIRSELGKILTDEEMKTVTIGGIRIYPETYGCFKKYDSWFTYVVNDRNFAIMKGPFDLKNAIISIAVSMHKPELDFDNVEAENVYLSNRFTSLEEIDNQFSKK